MLRPVGRWIVVTPLPEHLEQVCGSLGLVGVEECKSDRLHAELADFEAVTDS